MGKPSKSTKKFVKKQLGSALAVRRKLKPMKNALRRKQESSDRKRLDRLSVSEEGGGQSRTKRVEDMDVDEMLRGDFLDNISDDEKYVGTEDVDDDLPAEKGDDDDFVDVTSQGLEDDSSADEEEEEGLGTQNKKLKSEVDKHKVELERLKKKDPEFYKFLQEHDKELLEFEDEEPEDEGEHDDTNDDHVVRETAEKGGASKGNQQVMLSAALVDAWSNAIMEKQHVGAVRNMLRAYRSACHYGDGEGEDLSSKFNVASSHVFNRIMVFVLSEMDGVFKSMLGQQDDADRKNGKLAGAIDFQKNSKWKKVEPFARTYLANSHHILTQMSDNQMIGFTLRRIKLSVPFLAAFPKLARLYLKAALHFWSSSEGSLPVISLLFIREMALQLGTDYLDTCLKGIYKEFAANSRFVNPTRLPQIRFMANCVVELYGIDLGASYQHAFVFIRQLAILLRNAFTVKTKEAFKSVYRWQYMNCLELWVNILCAFSSKDDLRPLIYPVAQIIIGVARLVPTVKYFPLRLHCARLLNRLSASTGSYIPVSTLLMDILQFKELHVPASGGAGNAFDFSVNLKVPKAMLKTRAFHEECVFSVINQLAEHLAQWSCAVAFPELAVVPLVHLRRFSKVKTADRFRRQIKQLIEHIERNVEFVTRHREKVTFSPKDVPAVTAFLQDERKSGASPLLQYAGQLRQRSADRQKNLQTSNLVVGDSTPSVPDSLEDEEDQAQEQGEDVFSKDWLPQKRCSGLIKEEKSSRPKTGSTPGEEEDVVEELLLSSEDDMAEGAIAASESSDSEDDERAARNVKSTSKQNATGGRGETGEKEKTGSKPHVGRKRGTKRRRDDSAGHHPGRSSAGANGYSKSSADTTGNKHYRGQRGRRKSHRQ